VICDRGGIREMKRRVFDTGEESTMDVDLRGDGIAIDSLGREASWEKSDRGRVVSRRTEGNWPQPGKKIIIPFF
jgi:hypothetical protein